SNFRGGSALQSGSGADWPASAARMRPGAVAGDGSLAFGGGPTFPAGIGGAAAAESFAIPTVVLRRRTPGLASQEPLDHGRKGLEWHGVVVGVERGLVVFIAEVETELECRMSPMLLARIPVEPEMMEIEIALEKAVLTDHPVDVRSHIGLQDRRG